MSRFSFCRRRPIDGALSLVWSVTAAGWPGHDDGAVARRKVLAGGPQNSDPQQLEELLAGFRVAGQP
jgi:hypothetical protein